MPPAGAGKEVVLTGMLNVHRPRGGEQAPFYFILGPEGEECVLDLTANAAGLGSLVYEQIMVRGRLERCRGKNHLEVASFQVVSPEWGEEEVDY